MTPSELTIAITALPWRYVRHYNKHPLGSIFAGGLLVGNIEPAACCRQEQLDTNGRFIVLAVNNHATLLAACKQMLAVLNQQAEGYSLGATTPECHSAAMAAGSAAIDLVECSTSYLM